MKRLYTAEVEVTGGRSGHARSSDGKLEVALSTPAEMGGPGGAGTNPEQLFAAGFAACFESALMVAARRQGKDVDNVRIRAVVGIGPIENRAFGLDVELHVALPGIPRAEAEALVEQAHAVCPYSNATRGNIPVQLIVEEAA